MRFLQLYAINASIHISCKSHSSADKVREDYSICLASFAVVVLMPSFCSDSSLVLVEVEVVVVLLGVVVGFEIVPSKYLWTLQALAAMVMQFLKCT